LIAEKFEQIRRILYGSDNGGVGNSSQLVCVSRDNDGRDPYVLATKDGVTVTRIRGTSSSSMNACQTMIDGIRTIENRKILCVSRDNDSRDPYILAVLEGTTLKKIVPSSVNNVQLCQSTVESLKRVRGTSSVVFCASRDGDGRDPYTAIELDLSDLSYKRGTESFRTLDDCKRFL
jgi:hypothetical protein